MRTRSPLLVFGQPLRPGEARRRFDEIQIPPGIIPGLGVGVPTPIGPGPGGAGGPGTIAPSPDASIPTKIANAILTHFDERQEVIWKGLPMRVGTTLEFRFRTARACSFVQVLVTGPSGTLFDQLVDCQQQQVQDISVDSSASGVYSIALTPVQRTSLDGDIHFDGVDGRPDFKSFWEYRVP